MTILGYKNIFLVGILTLSVLCLAETKPTPREPYSPRRSDIKILTCNLYKAGSFVNFELSESPMSKPGQTTTTALEIYRSVAKKIYVARMLYYRFGGPNLGNSYDTLMISVESLESSNSKFEFSSTTQIPALLPGARIKVFSTGYIREDGHRIELTLDCRMAE